MKENEKLIDAIIDLSQKVKRLGNDLGGLSQEMKGMRKEQQETNHRLEKLEKQQQLTNKAIGELRLSYMKVADETAGLRTDFGELRFEFSGLRSEFSKLRADFNKYAASNNARVNGHEKRIVQLEDAISDNGGKRMFIAKEPEAKYEKKKKNDK